MNDSLLTADVFGGGAVHVLPEIDIRGIKRRFLDLSYACDSEYQKLDIYLPGKGDGPFPLIAFIHGGGWRRGDKRDIQIAGFMKLLDKGYAIAGINYRLSFEARYPACVEDCKTAIRYIKAHADSFRIDPERVAAAGGSAGGHISLMLSTEKSDPEECPLVKCAVALFPATDFSTEFSQAAENERNGIINLSDNSRDPDDPDSPEAALLGGAMNTLDSERLLGASPIDHIYRGMPAVLLQHGKMDYIIPCRQSIDFCEKARSMGVDVEMDIFEGAIHMDPLFQTDENMSRIEAFIAQNI